jgi:DNA-binding MltR family transcriptional regulator
MAAKGSKGTNRIHYAELFSGITEGIGPIAMSDVMSCIDEMQVDVERINTINMDTIFDNIIKKLLLLHFSQRDKTVKKLFDPNIGGPLVSLTHKARLAYAMGLIDKIALNDLEHIRRIRNIFAHSIEASFADTEVVKFVRKLSTAKDQEITAKNSYKFYRKAVGKCSTSLDEATKQEIYRLSMLREVKKKAKVTNK